MVRLVDDIQIEPFVIFGISSPVSSLLIHDLCFLVILVIDYVVKYLHPGLHFIEYTYT